MPSARLPPGGDVTPSGKSKAAPAREKTSAAKAPTTAAGYNSRGYARQVKGDLDGAIVDYDKAVAIDPAYALAYINRANVRHARGEFETALADYNHAIAVAKDNAPYARLYRYLVQRRLQRADADEELSRGFAGASQNWSRTVARFLTGQVSETNMLATAVRGKGKTPLSLPCESYYFAGMKALLAGETERARSFFEKCVGTNETARSAFMLARAELARLTAAAPNAPQAR